MRSPSDHRAAAQPAPASFAEWFIDFAFALIVVGVALAIGLVAVLGAAALLVEAWR